MFLTRSFENMFNFYFSPYVRTNMENYCFEQSSVEGQVFMHIFGISSIEYECFCENDWNSSLNWSHKLN